MFNRLAKLWRAVRDRVAHWRNEIDQRRNRVNLTPDQLSVLIETASECEREEVGRLREELARERAEKDRLRDEIERLKLDNRALLNSLLGTAGIPPLEVPRTGAEAPVRRPSWPQIAAKREAAAGRKGEQARKAQHVPNDPVR